MNESIVNLRRVKKLITSLFIFTIVLGMCTIAYYISLMRKGFTFAFFDIKLIYLIPFFIFIIILILILYDDFKYHINKDFKNEKLKISIPIKFNAHVGSYVPIICKDLSAISVLNLESFGKENLKFFLHLTSNDTIQIIIRSKRLNQIYVTKDFAFFAKNFKPIEDA